MITDTERMILIYAENNDAHPVRYLKKIYLWLATLQSTRLTLPRQRQNPYGSRVRDRSRKNSEEDKRKKEEEE